MIEIGTVLIVAFIVWLIYRAIETDKENKKKRKDELIAKYGEDEANRMLNGEIWMGMTAEQVLETIGKPDMVDQKQMAKCSREVLKWRESGKRRIAYQITCDDGIVTGISDRRIK